MGVGQQNTNRQQDNGNEDWDALKGDVGDIAGVAAERSRYFIDSAREQATDYVDRRKDDIAQSVAKSVAARHVDVGILIDGAGIGSAMAANKVAGVRAAACYTSALARNSREHNGANVLSLGSGQTSIEDMKEIVHTFITTEITEERHKRRVSKIDAIEKEYRI